MIQGCDQEHQCFLFIILDMVSVWVKWDCGHKNVYCFLPLIGQEVVVVDEPRKLDGEIIAVGCRVERGKYCKRLHKFVR